MENEQSTNQKCLDFLESTETERQKISESLEDEFEVSFLEVLAKIWLLYSKMNSPENFKEFIAKFWSSRFSV